MIHFVRQLVAQTKFKRILRTKANILPGNVVKILGKLSRISIPMKRIIVIKIGWLFLLAGIRFL